MVDPLVDLVKPCSRCAAFCASWSLDNDNDFEPTRLIGYDVMHGSDGNNNDSPDNTEPVVNTLKAGHATNDGFTKEERVALLSSLQKIAQRRRQFGNNRNLATLADPLFLQKNVQELLVDPLAREGIQLMVTYGCNKVLPEARLLAKGFGMEELQTWLVPLPRDLDYDMEEKEEGIMMEEEVHGLHNWPYEDFDQEEHYLLTPEQ